MPRVGWELVFECISTWMSVLVTVELLARVDSVLRAD